jgi:hypothetical protein
MRASRPHILLPVALPERKGPIEQQLPQYCKLDTHAMARLWQDFSDSTDLKL